MLLKIFICVAILAITTRQPDMLGIVFGIVHRLPVSSEVSYAAKFIK